MSRMIFSSFDAYRYILNFSRYIENIEMLPEKHVRELVFINKNYEKQIYFTILCINLKENFLFIKKKRNYFFFQSLY